jgi:hypothetical protein
VCRCEVRAHLPNFHRAFVKLVGVAIAIASEVAMSLSLCFLSKSMLIVFNKENCVLMQARVLTSILGKNTEVFLFYLVLLYTCEQIILSCQD